MRIKNEPMRFWYRLAKNIIHLFLKILYRLSAEGIENIPLKGGVIIASNHASFLDPTCVGVFVPRELTFFAKKELFSIPVFRSAITYVNALAVDRRGFSRSALQEVIERLNEGWAVLIFPEGTRTKTGEFLEPKRGPGMIALVTNVPIVPCWVEGSFRAKVFRSKITVHFLKPFKPSEIEAETKKEQYLLVSKRIMYDINNIYKMHLALRNKAGSHEK